MEKELKNDFLTAFISNVKDYVDEYEFRDKMKKIEASIFDSFDYKQRQLVIIMIKKVLELYRKGLVTYEATAKV